MLHADDPAKSPAAKESLTRRSRPYDFYSETRSLCECCLSLVPAKVVFENNSVFFLKHCSTHGHQKTLISTDKDYYLLSRSFLKPGDLPLKFQSQTHFGCPYDCGLCPDHEQHSCLAILEINTKCNLECPTCFNESGPSKKEELSLEKINELLDLLVESEGEADLLQISGGEPSIHPQILDIIALCKTKRIRHIMLNTNGVRIATDEEFVKKLAEFKPGFEVYLQFDSLNDDKLNVLRGANLSKIRIKALENLAKHGVSTTLVSVVRKGLNDDELGATVEFALSWPNVRGVTFQPVQDVGRNLDFAPDKNRMTLSEVRTGIIEQSVHFQTEDLLPLPCNPEHISIGYGLRNGKSFLPITRLISDYGLMKSLPNTISFEAYPKLRSDVFEFLKSANVQAASEEKIASYLCCLPEFKIPEKLSYNDVFRVAIVEFMDRFNFCVGGVKKSCIHFLTPEKKIIPFETYNLFYRDKKIDGIRKSLINASPGASK